MNMVSTGSFELLRHGNRTLYRLSFQDPAQNDGREDGGIVWYEVADYGISLKYVTSDKYSDLGSLRKLTEEEPECNNSIGESLI